MNNIDASFYQIFPNGLNDELWVKLGKKHSPDKIIDMIHSDLSLENMELLIKDGRTDVIAEIALKLVKKSTVISMFEKIAFQNFIKNTEIYDEFSICLKNLLHDFNKKSFENMVDVLCTYKMDKNSNPAKWPVITFFMAYNDANNRVIVKPTTVKSAALYLNVDIEYKPLPNYNTYCKVEKMIKDFKENSIICRNENLMISQAVLFTVTKM